MKTMLCVLLVLGAAGITQADEIKDPWVKTKPATQAEPMALTETPNSDARRADFLAACQNLCDGNACRQICRNVIDNRDEEVEQQCNVLTQAAQKAEVDAWPKGMLEPFVNYWAVACTETCLALAKKGLTLTQIISQLHWGAWGKPVPVAGALWWAYNEMGSCCQAAWKTTSMKEPGLVKGLHAIGQRMAHPELIPPCEAHNVDPCIEVLKSGRTRPELLNIACGGAKPEEALRIYTAIAGCDKHPEQIRAFAKKEADLYAQEVAEAQAELAQKRAEQLAEQAVAAANLLKVQQKAAPALKALLKCTGAKCTPHNLWELYRLFADLCERYAGKAQAVKALKYYKNYAKKNKIVYYERIKEATDFIEQMNQAIGSETALLRKTLRHSGSLAMCKKMESVLGDVDLPDVYTYPFEIDQD